MKEIIERLSKEHQPQSLTSLYFHASSSSELIQALKQHLEAWSAEGATERFEEDLQKFSSLKAEQAQPRIGLLVADQEQACLLLEKSIEALSKDSEVSELKITGGAYYAAQGAAAADKVVALFSGQGSQYLEMGKELLVEYPELCSVVEQIDQMFATDDALLLSDAMYPSPSEDAEVKKEQQQQLQKTEYAQPAIGAMSAGLFQIATSAGFKADITAGHSFGELSALWAAEVFSDQDYYFLARSRGKAMAPPADPNFDAGTMMAVRGDAQQIQEHLKAIPEVKLANFNSPTQSVLAAPLNKLQEAQQLLKSHKIRGMILPVSAAFHTPLVQHAQVPFAASMEKVIFQEPQLGVYSNETAEAYSKNPELIRETLQKHILESVHFSQEIQNIHQAGGRVFVEFGPKNVLTNLTKSILQGQPHHAFAFNNSASEDSVSQLKETLMQLTTLGVLHPV